MRPSSWALVVEGESVLVRGYGELEAALRGAIDDLLQARGVAAGLAGETLVVPRRDGEGTDLAPLLGRCLRPRGRREEALARIRARVVPRPRPETLDFGAIEARAQALADRIEARREALVELLLRYETFTVAADEIARTLDLLRSLAENRPYFLRRIGDVAVFLPSNQPLYALACFGVVPSFLARRVLVRPPRAMGPFFEGIVDLLALPARCPELVVSRLGRGDFVAACQGVEAVIFTGTHASALAIRRAFRPEVLLIVNGAGHNPIVVSETADLGRAIDSIVRVQLYNQGQDCASPSAILVHRARHAELAERLREAVRRVKVGPYADRASLVGPISRLEHLPRIQALLCENVRWLDAEAEGVVRTRSGIVTPAIVWRPLEAGGNFVEQLAPIFFVQRYDDDAELARYFEDPRYARHAMYVTVFGRSAYVEGLVDRRLPGGRLLHDASTLLRDTDLHAPGVERGTQPYGGYGEGASCLSLGGVVTAKPTLPPRDLHVELVVPSL